jgi:pyrroline-5-carboxylate reductase
VQTPACGFIGWGAESAAMLEVLRGRFADIDAHCALLAGSAAAPAEGPRPPRAPAPEVPAVDVPRPPARTLPSLEALFASARLVFAEGGPAALAPYLPMIRLAIADRHVLVLLGAGWSLEALAAPLNERKLARCMLLPGRPGAPASLAFHTSPHFTAAERADFAALFAHLELCVELREERHFELLQGLVDFAPAAFYTVLEAMADGVVLLGFSRTAALRILASLLEGAAQRVLDGERTTGQLREQALEVDVAAAGLIELESSGIRGALMRAIQKSVRRPRTATLATGNERD